VKTVVAALLGLAVLALGAMVWTSWADLRAAREADTTGEAAAQAVAAARAIAPDLLSYDHRTVEQDLARAAGHTTGALTGRYRQLAGTLGPRARAQKTVQTASVAAAAVERAEPGRVEILLFVNTGTVKELPGEAEPQRQITRNRARLVMVRHDSRWLAADLSTLIGGA
jgi:Mce-associated membrane protein